jgi:site-specific DNA-cytosine methylase
MFDSFHGGCGGSVAAINAGLFVQTGADSAIDKRKQFQALTGRVSLGDVRLLRNNRLPRVHIWFSCSSCNDFARLGSKRGIKGSRGGSLFTKQFDAAKAAGATVVVLENVDGVATLDGGIALKQLIDNAAKAGFTQLFHKKITFALFGDPENRSRRVIVAFHDSVVLSKQWKWPEPSYENWSLDHNNRMCAGEVLFPSTMVPARFWDDRPWHKVKKTWTKKDDCAFAQWDTKI